MYHIEHVKRALDNPKELLRELNRLYHTNFRRDEYNQSGTNFFDEDWDNLIILDACRYDTFARLVDDFDLPGELTSRRSRGACTMEFLKGNVHGRDLTDTVYISGTTMMYRESIFKEQIDVTFHDVVDVWKDSIDIGEWGIHPETMADETRNVSDEYPRKRIVAHFIQPHIPFIGETADEYGDRIGNTVWRDCFNGSISVSDDVIRQAYEENARIVLKEVASLVTDLRGKTAITSDHGQYLGERASPVPIKEYGHPHGIYTDVLTKTPWFIHLNGERKDIVGKSRSETYEDRRTDDLDEKAKEHLKQLGYL